jgi:hypothetical protein
MHPQLVRIGSLAPRILDPHVGASDVIVTVQRECAVSARRLPRVANHQPGVGLGENNWADIAVHISAEDSEQSQWIRSIGLRVF